MKHFLILLNEKQPELLDDRLLKAYYQEFIAAGKENNWLLDSDQASS